MTDSPPDISARLPPAPAHRHRGSSPAAPQVERALLIVGLGLTFTAHLHFVLRQNINWDEFWFLSFVYDHAFGRLSRPRQSFHVHLFGWLPAIDGHEVEQVIAGRAVFFLLLIGTCACVYALARRTASVNGSLFATLCCAGYSNVLYYGTSFRADGLSICLLMTALVLMQLRARRTLVLCASATLVATALLVTIKSVFFLPVFAVRLLAHHPQDRRDAARREAMLFAGISIGIATVLYLWHGREIVVSPDRVPVTPLPSIAARMLWRDALFPRFPEFLDSLLRNLVQWAFLAYSCVALSRRVLARQQVCETASLLILTLPLLSVLFYRNAFPYFYVFVMPAALVLCGLGYDRLTANRTSRRDDIPITFLATLIIAGSALAHVSLRWQDGTTAQRQVIQAVHEIFPEPVPYIDRNGMVSSFPKVGFFMSTLGLRNYRDAGRPVFADLLRTRGPKFLLVNSPALSSVFEERSGTVDGEQLLMASDVAVLREHFVPYWGPVYVAGRALHLPQDLEVAWEVLLEGTYRLYSNGPVVIGGALHQPGSTVTLASGGVSFRSHATQDVVLRTISAQGVPSYPPPREPLYTGF
jgi:hypothetical protein